MKSGYALGIVLPLVLAMLSPPVLGHHTLGINQAGKATASPQIPTALELQVEHFLVSLAVLPGQPAVNQTTRLIAYVKDTQTHKPFLGELEFRVAGKGWFGDDEPLLEERKRPIEDRYIGMLQFPENGTYGIQLGFSVGGQTYSPSFTLQVGAATAPWKYLLGAVLVLLLGGVIWRARKRRARPRPV